MNTRPIELVGAHCKGHNARSIGICYEGGLDAKGRPKDTRTVEQRSALRLLVAQLLKRFKNNVRVCGHRDLSPDLNGDGRIEPEEWVKECPCFEVGKGTLIIIQSTKSFKKENTKGGVKLWQSRNQYGI